MATSKSTDKIESTASGTRSGGQPLLQIESENASQWQGASIPVLGTSNKMTPHGNVSTSEAYSVSQQSALLDTNGEPYSTVDILLPALTSGTGEQSGRKVVLKDILLKCSSPDHFDDELTLVIVRGGTFVPLSVTKISPTIWKPVVNIELSHNDDDIMMIVQSQEGTDEAFLILTGDELYAMACAEEDTPMEHELASVEENNKIRVKMTSTVVSSLSPTRSGVLNFPMFEACHLAWLNAKKFQHRFEETGNTDNIAQAISHCERAISLLPPGQDITPQMSYFLGNSYSNLFEHTENVQDIDHAISHLKNAVDSTPSGHATLPSLCNNLGNSYLSRFEHTENLQDINCAIAQHQRAVESTHFGDANLPTCFNNLGNSYLGRFGLTGDLKDIDRAISHHQRAVDSTPSDHADLPGWFNNLGNSYLGHFRRTGDLKDIDCAISHHQRADKSTPYDHADLPSMFNNLGTSYLCRFEHTGHLQDIDYAISHHQRAVGGTPSGHIDLPTRFNNLGGSYMRRFEHIGDLQDIESSISYRQQAIELTPSGHATLPSWFIGLGNSYSCRFQRFGDLQDIECAISLHQKAIDATPSGHAELPGRLNNLGTSYRNRFEHTGDLQDITRSISHHQTAIESTPSGHTDLPTYFSSLGKSYLCRYEHTGGLQDIECAILQHQQATVSTPSGHADLPNRFDSLGNSYLRHFERTGDLHDIDCAISQHEKAVKFTPSGHADLPSRLSNLGSSYQFHFQHTGDLQDIDCAISHYQRAIDSTPSGHSDLPSLFSNLGNSYLRRFRRTRDLQDINCAIAHHQKVVISTPPDHIDLPTRFNNLGSSYLCRFERSGDIQDIDLAISHHQKATESTPSGHAGLPNLFKNLGDSYSSRFNNNDYFPDIQNSIAAYRRGADLNGDPSVRLTCAKIAAMHSSVHDRSQCLNDFSVSISLLSEAAGLEQIIHRRYANLKGHSDFVRFAVATALELSSPDLALEWLEQGRCLVWSQLNQLRTPIDNLRAHSPSLADRFSTAASSLESYGSRSARSGASLDMSLREDILHQNDTRNHTLYAAQYKQLLEEIRALPDFQNFLRAPKATDILDSLPSDGPVIIFNLHESRCDALALIAGIEEPLHIPLENFNLERAQKLQKTLRFDLLKRRDMEDQDRLPRHVRLNPSSMSFVLEELWCKVVLPILEALGYSSQNASDRRRIWWCPTGPLAFLPLHAAGIYGSPYKPGSCISDFAVSSYTPTVQSLKDKSSTSFAVSNRTSLLLINPNTPGLTSIPFTEMETHHLKGLMDQSGIDALLLEDATADTDTVKRELNTYNWVHFACHGIQDAKDSLKSGVHLYDGRLELLEIMRQKLPNPQLAFLSACQTSTGDLELSEEVVHLAAGMLAAGYRGVVGTMWSISDLHGPEFAKHFYEYLLKEKGSEGLDSTQAAYALDYATRKVRECLGEGDATLLTWVPYVHFGY